MKSNNSRNSSHRTDSEYRRLITNRLALEQKINDLEKALIVFCEYSKDLMNDHPWKLVGEIMQTSKGKYRITDIDSGYNEKINRRDWLFTMMSYETSVMITVWYTDLYENYANNKVAFIRF